MRCHPSPAGVMVKVLCNHLSCCCCCCYISKFHRTRSIIGDQRGPGSRKPGKSRNNSKSLLIWVFPIYILKSGADRLAVNSKITCNSQILNPAMYQRSAEDGTFCSGAYRATFLVSSGKIGFNGLKIIVIPYRIFKLLIRKCFQASKTT